MTPSGSAKAFNIIARKDTGSGAGDQAGKVSLPGGWQGETHMSWSHLPRSKSYHFNFVNKSSSTNKMKSVKLMYE